MPPFIVIIDWITGYLGAACVHLDTLDFCWPDIYLTVPEAHRDTWTNDFQLPAYRVSQLMSASISIKADNTYVWHFS